MSSFVIALLFGLGAGGWVYGKTFKKTGGLTKSAWTTAIVSGIACLVLAWIILSIIFK